MSLITWTAEQYGTQIDFADEEHRVLFDKWISNCLTNSTTPLLV